MGLFCWYHLTHPAGVGGFFFFLMKQFQLLSQGRLIQTHPKHSRLSAFSRNSESTGSCQRDTFSLLHGNILFLVCITLSPRRQVTHVTWLSASPPLRCLHMGQGTPLCFLGKKLPQGQGNRPSQRLLPHPSPTQEAYRPSGWAGPDGCGTSFLPHFYFSFWSFVLEGEALKNILFSGLRS